MQKHLLKIFFIVFFVLFGVLLSKNIAPHYIRNISSASEMYMDVEGTDIKGEKISLPYTLKNVEKGAKIHLYNDFVISSNDMMYIKTVYAPLRITADNAEIYSYGQKGTYPDILKDPPTQVCLINIPTAERVTHIEFIYEFPYDRDNLSLSPPLYGEGSDLMRYLFFKMSVPFVLSILQIFIGAFLIIMFIALLPSEIKASSLMWLGLFGISFGLWSLCECNFTVLIVQRPYLLYIGAFMGMFVTSLPILMFTRCIQDKKSKVLDALTAVTAVSVLAAVILQLSGRLPFHKSMFFFHYLMLANFIAMCTIVCIRGTKDKNMKRFSAAYVAMTFFVMLELINYSLNFVSYNTLFFQIGVLVFLVMNEYLTGIDLRNIVMLRTENRRLAENMAIMEKQMTAQYESGRMLIDTAEELKRQRHDLKHQYIVLDGFIDEKEYGKAKAYIEKLIKAIPQDNVKVYCRNDALNAIITYYAKAAEDNNIKYDISLEIPPEISKGSDLTESQLCMVFGNLLENAVEACCRTESQGRFIKLCSYIKAGILYIAMDNNCDGNIHIENGGFISSKRNEIGTGINSITAIAKKHGGDAKFNVNGDIFESSVYICI